MKLGFIGSGKMAAALVEGVLQAGVFAKGDIIVTDRYEAAVKALVKKCRVKSVPDNATLAAQSDVIVCCVKPGDAEEALAIVRESGAEKLVISIMAGVTLSRLRDYCGKKARVVRVMPNTPALIHKGAAAYAPGKGAPVEDAAVVEKIFAAVGKVFCVKEDLMDVVTGLSGSGPAYVYVVIEALADAGVLMGLPRELSLQLAAQTVSGAAEMVLQTGLHPAQLKDQVTSPGGTTIAGIEALENAKVRSAFLSAVRAATQRSRELGSGK
ncbi:MAG: pyrroline-5-carboxylate reductase [Verrucomicrobiota bacterium]